MPCSSGGFPQLKHYSCVVIGWHKCVYSFKLKLFWHLTLQFHCKFDVRFLFSNFDFEKKLSNVKCANRQHHRQDLSQLFFCLFESCLELWLLVRSSKFLRLLPMFIVQITTKVRLVRACKCQNPSTTDGEGDWSVIKLVVLVNVRCKWNCLSRPGWTLLRVWVIPRWWNKSVEMDHIITGELLWSNFVH